MRKDFGETLSPEHDLVVEDATGVSWVITLKGIPSSSERGATGVAVIQQTPTNIGLSRWGDINVFRLQYNDSTLKLWAELIADAKAAIAQGVTTSPAPDMLVYGKILPWRYPDAYTAMNRLWSRHASFVRPITDRSKSMGGIADNPRAIMVAKVDSELATRHPEVYAHALISRNDRTLSALWGGRLAFVAPLPDNTGELEDLAALIGPQDHAKPTQVILTTDESTDDPNVLRNGQLIMATFGIENTKVTNSTDAADEVVRFLRRG